MAELNTQQGWDSNRRPSGKMGETVLSTRWDSKRGPSHHTSTFQPLHHVEPRNERCLVVSRMNDEKVGGDASENDNFQRGKQLLLCSIFSDTTIFNAVVFCVIKVFCSSFNNLIFWDGSINVICQMKYCKISNSKKIYPDLQYFIGFRELSVISLNSSKLHKNVGKKWLIA